MVSCSREYFAHAVRVFSGLLGATCIVLSIIAFNQLNRAVQNRASKTVKDNELLSGLLFLYLFISGLLLILGEIRTGWLRRTVLKPFGFICSRLGRGMFHWFVASFLVLFSSTFALIVGILMFVCGFCLFVLIFIYNDPDEEEMPHVGSSRRGSQDAAAPAPASGGRYGAAEQPTRGEKTFDPVAQEQQERRAEKQEERRHEENPFA